MRMLSRDRADWAFLAAGLFAALLVPRHIDGDDVIRFDALTRLLARGEVVPTAYSAVGPLLSGPLWWLGRLLGPSPARWVVFWNLLLFAAGLCALNALLRGVVADAVRRRFLLLLLFGSMFAHHLTNYGAETFSAVLAAVGLALVGVRGSGWGWPPLVLAAVNTPAMLAPLTLVAGWEAVRRRRLRPLLAPAAAAALFLLESWVRRGSPFHSGYEGNGDGGGTIMPYSGRGGFSYPFFFGLLSILLSFGKGLVFFAPGLLLVPPPGSLSPPARAVRCLWLLFLAGLVLVYARWWAWYGGFTWGPRFFLFASVPASFGLAVALQEGHSAGRNLLALLALALSFWVGYDGLAIGAQHLEIGVADGYALEHVVWYVPEFSVLWRPFVVAPLVPTRSKLIGLLYLGCFAHLAVPPVAACLRQAREALRDFRAARRALGPWRF